MKILLFRHGEKQFSDSMIYAERYARLLTPKGIEQISKLGNRLSEMDLPHEQLKFFSSPYPRAIQSAEIVRSILGLPEYKINKALEEFYGYDDYSLPQEERYEIMRSAMADPDKPVSVEPGSLNNHLDRLEGFFIDKYQGDEKLLLCSAHGAIIRTWAYRLSPKVRPEPGVIKDAKIHNAGYTIVEYNGENFELKEFDVWHHLL